MNYNLMMEQEIERIKKLEYVPKLLLHACCAPCTSSCLERLGDYFKITILFYNPNITDYDEYIKRLNELKRFISIFKVKYEVDIIELDFNNNTFFELSKGLENSPEKGNRCYKCYKERLRKTAQICSEKDFDYFTTTLTLSPHKVTSWINEIGEDLAATYNVKFLNCDFKKKNGYKRSIELSEKYNLYRQNYCGCIYSKKTSKSISN